MARIVLLAFILSSIHVHAAKVVFSAAMVSKPGSANAPVKESKYSFSGDQWIQIPRPVQDDFTLSCEFRTTDPNHQPTPGWGADNEPMCNFYQACGLLDAESSNVVNDFGLGFRNGAVVFGIGNPDTTIHSHGGLNDGQWHTAWATRHKATGDFELFVDGVSVGKMNNGNTNSLTSSSTVTIGSQNNDPATEPGRQFIGEMRNIAIYDQVVHPFVLAETTQYDMPIEFSEEAAAKPERNGTILSTTLSGMIGGVLGAVVITMLVSKHRPGFSHALLG